ncbi:MAG TPA: nucleotidyl transferase AbiEii/AbiGii toxin family protein [Candidatus Tectomicrobia bacterium]
MNQRTGSHIATSIRQRLLNKARETGRPFNEILQYFAIERFLYRLARSPHADKFVLKGAVMFAAWQAPISRPTMDIDLLGFTNNSIDAIVAVTQVICTQVVEPDGLTFEPESVAGERIVEDADYAGVRVRFRGILGTARITMQLDIGFGDVIVPQPVPIEYPTILPLPAPRLRGYSRESAIAEKFEAMVKLGMLNSRMKDFFDVWLLAHQFDFEGRILTTAIAQTFATRRTVVPAEPIALTDAFAADTGKQSQWQSFIRRSRLQHAPDSLVDVVTTLAVFLRPITKALASREVFEHVWQAPGPWRRMGN